MTNISLDTLKGRGVVGAGGRFFGTVEDLEVDPKTWKITSLLIRANQHCLEDLGLKKPLFRNVRLTLPIQEIGDIGDVILLKITLEDFAQLVRGARKAPARKERETEKELQEAAAK